ncbi:MAG: hypothetical protein ABL998_23875, partial [Planctomycetota bacterium]
MREPGQAGCEQYEFEIGDAALDGRESDEPHVCHCRARHRRRTGEPVRVGFSRHDRREHGQEREVPRRPAEVPAQVERAGVVQCEGERREQAEGLRREREPARGARGLQVGEREHGREGQREAEARPGRSAACEDPAAEQELRAGQRQHPERGPAPLARHEQQPE